MIREHTDRQYAAELRELRNRLLLMTGRVEQMIARSVEAVVNQDTDLAKKTIARDHRVNRDEIETDELCLLILAKWQPMATDLRFITLALKMVTDLERMADHSSW
jgi:phosphate transport system protein